MQTPEPTPRSPRQGYRKFYCEECKKYFEEPTRDALSPSTSYCPKCFDALAPIEGRIDPTLPVDRFGNLLEEPPTKELNQ